MKTIAFLNNQVQKRMEREALRTGINALSEVGYANGYVAIPPEHPFYEESYDNIYSDVDVWGGLTFSAKCADCCWDKECIEMIDGGTFDDVPKDWWIFGFDTMHFGDSPEHDRQWCINETKSMQKQLEAVMPDNINNH